MTNKNRLKNTVKCFGYDKGLEDVLIQGVSRLPDSIVVRLLEDLDSFQASINNTFSEIDCLIAQVQARQEILNKPTEIDRNALNPDSASPQIFEETSCKPIQADKVCITSSESKKPLQTFNQIEYFLDISSMYFVAMSAWMDMWSAYLRINSISEGIYPKVSSEQSSGSATAVAAVQSAIASANSAFDNMRKTAKQVSDMAQSNMAAATSATTKAASAATTKSK